MIQKTVKFKAYLFHSPQSNPAQTPLLKANQLKKKTLSISVFLANMHTVCKFTISMHTNTEEYFFKVIIIDTHENTFKLSFPYLNFILFLLVAYLLHHQINISCF